MRVGLLGDVHLNEEWALRAIAAFGGDGITTIIQVGDLGVWPGRAAAKTWDRVNDALAANGQEMLVAPGNHEEYPRIERLVARDDGWLSFRERILLAPRGHRTALGGRSVVWLGGAGSIDRENRLPVYGERRPPSARTWWAAEAISDADVAVTASGGHAEIMVSHEAPHGVQALADLSSRVEGATASDIAYCAQVRARLDEAFRAVGPRLLVHGHYHRPVDEFISVADSKCHVVGLACDDEEYALGVLETETLAVTAWRLPEAGAR